MNNYVVLDWRDWPVYKTDDLADAIRVCKDLQDGLDTERSACVCIIDIKKGVIVEW